MSKPPRYLTCMLHWPVWYRPCLPSEAAERETVEQTNLPLNSLRLGAQAAVKPAADTACRGTQSEQPLPAGYLRRLPSALWHHYSLHLALNSRSEVKVTRAPPHPSLPKPRLSSPLVQITSHSHPRPIYFLLLPYSLRFRLLIVRWLETFVPASPFFLRLV